jgi:uncharacterized protein YndB with AHSA1/START domain
LTPRNPSVASLFLVGYTATRRLPMTASTDRIEKHIVLHAPHERVWRALTDSREFGAWFGMKLDGPFVAGKVVRGTIVPTQADAEIAKLQKDFEGHPVELIVETIEPMCLFSFRWHPYAVERGVDYSGEPTTLVAFEVAKADGGIKLTVSESGFDAIPVARRAKAFAANEGGWGMVITLIGKYLAHAA